MAEELKLRRIARIYSDFLEKFGIPRQSSLVEELKSTVVFEPDYRDENAVKGIESYSHLWLIWEFSENERGKWSPTVRPPRLGGNTRMGVFATRSPFRPNPIGLSCVRLESVEIHPDKGPVLHIAGADLMDGTPILDIKPYLPYVDSHPEACGGFTELTKEYSLDVEIPALFLEKVPKEKREALKKVLSQDPRPAYQNDPGRNYGMSFAGMEIHFQVRDGVLHVTEILNPDETV
ncbi:MAG: tRNA (N6-threonylcarbamoyladenosine(37)-N6)-methyltransferase TrmO [Lachnospiraceae bacterium]|nr:tRNA (N6-threonylcarbamoyladenosine(37)-N6)-methyltransferase TrmO [Lachnospiraceae bacterium]